MTSSEKFAVSDVLFSPSPRGESHYSDLKNVLNVVGLRATVKSLERFGTRKSEHILLLIQTSELLCSDDTYVALL